MGQYWRIVNLTKKEYLDPYTLGSGAKLWEQVANDLPGRALIVLLAAMPVPRGGGDLNLDDDVAKRTIGRWAGDRIALVGDYGVRGDIRSMPKCPPADVYDECSAEGLYVDVTSDVLAVLRHELNDAMVTWPEEE